MVGVVIGKRAHFHWQWIAEKVAHDDIGIVRPGWAEGQLCLGMRGFESPDFGAELLPAPLHPVERIIAVPGGPFTIASRAIQPAAAVSTAARQTAITRLPFSFAPSRCKASSNPKAVSIASGTSTANKRVIAVSTNAAPLGAASNAIISTRPAGSRAWRTQLPKPNSVKGKKIQGMCP